MRLFAKWINDSRAALKYIILAGIFCMGYFILQKLHHRSGVSNFEVYYEAASRLFSSKEIYGISLDGGAGFYRYSPITIILFAPFTLLPLGVSSALYYFLILSSVIVFSLYIVYWLEKNIGLEAKNRGWLLVLVNLFLVDHIERELHLGNLNVFFHMMFFAVFIKLFQQKDSKAGIITGVILLFQPAYALILVWGILKSRFKYVLISLATVVVGLFIPILLYGPSTGWMLLQQWTDVYLHPGFDIASSPNTIYGIYNMWILHPIGFESGKPLVLGILIVVFGLFYIIFQNNKTNPEKRQTFFIEFFMLIALMPNLIHTDTEHFMWTWPILIYVFIRLQNSNLSKARWQIALLVILFVPLVVNSPDIVGRQWMLIFDEGGLMGFANLVLIGLAYYIFRKKVDSNVQLEGNASRL